METTVFLYKGGSQKVPFDVVRAKIDPSVKKIEEKAFQCRRRLEEVEFSEGLEEIGKNAFKDCQSLRLAQLPQSMRIIHDYAFETCDSLEEVDFSEGLVEIGRGAFSGCDLLEKVRLPRSLRIIKDYGFQYCWKLEIEFSEGLEEIGQDVFSFCAREYVPTAMKLPSTLRRIGIGGFSSFFELNSLTQVKPIGKTKLEVGRVRKDESDRLPSFEVPAGVEALGIFDLKDTTTSKVIAPTQGSYLPDMPPVCTKSCCAGKEKVFEYLGGRPETPKHITRAKVDPFVRKIEDNAFFNCALFREFQCLREVELSEGLVEIGYGAFFGCVSLQGIKLPATVRIIAGMAFARSGLRNIFLNEGLLEIQIGGLSSCKALTEIRLPSTMRVLGVGAFYSTPRLKTVILNDGLQEIGRDAFRLSGVDRLALPKSVKQIGLCNLTRTSIGNRDAEIQSLRKQVEDKKEEQRDGKPKRARIG